VTKILGYISKRSYETLIDIKQWSKREKIGNRATDQPSYFPFPLQVFKAANLGVCISERHELATIVSQLNQMHLHP
jgi:hypothetical protein